MSLFLIEFSHNMETCSHCHPGIFGFVKIFWIQSLDSTMNPLSTTKPTNKQRHSPPSVSLFPSLPSTLARTKHPLVANEVQVTQPTIRVSGQASVAQYVLYVFTSLSVRFTMSMHHGIHRDVCSCVRAH